MATDPLYDNATREAVVEAYQAGEKIVSIVTRLNIPRSSVYWILAEGGVAPSRMRRSDRLTGDRTQLAHLYEMLEAQNEYIHKLEAKVRELGGTVDE